MPLATLRHCYEAEFPKLDINDDGVPLEHLGKFFKFSRGFFGGKFKFNF